MRGLKDKRIVVAGGATGIGLSDDAEWINGRTWSADDGGSPHD